MYKEILKKNDVLRLPALVDNLMFITSKKNRNILAYHNMKQIWVTNEKNYNCNIIGDEIITANLKIYDLKGDVKYKHDDYENYHFVVLDRINRLSIWKTVDEEKEIVLYHIFDLETKTFIKENIVSKNPLFFIYKDCFVCRNSDVEISIFNFKSIEQLWQQDLSEYLKRYSDGKEKQGKINQVKLYKDSLIVVSDGGVLRLALETGEIIWKVKGYTRTMEIVENIGYCCSGLSLWKLNLETGEESGYGWEYHRLPDIKWNGRTYWPGGHEVIYHEGLLWYSVFASGHSFLVAINPHDGHYKWVHHVETNEKIDSPKFHNNKMFLLDTGGTLHIYEKEEFMP